MTRDELAAIKERVELTPGGRWTWSSGALHSDETDACLAWVTRDVNDNLYIGLMEEVAEFISCARADVLKLLAEVEILQRVIHNKDIYLKKVQDSIIESYAIE